MSNASGSSRDGSRRRKSSAMSGLRNGARSGRNDASHPVIENAIRLSDASGNYARRAGNLSDLWHGAGAPYRNSGRAAERRIYFHDATILAKRRANHSNFSDGHVGFISRQASPTFPLDARNHLDRILVFHARRSVGRMAIFRARRCFNRPSEN